jgi:hypothetical protein
MTPEEEDAYVVSKMQTLGRMVKILLPDKWGFVVLAFPLNTDEGRMNYVSNAERKDVVRAMYEFIEKTKVQWGAHELPVTAATEDKELARARQRIAELERENEVLANQITELQDRDS